MDKNYNPLNPMVDQVKKFLDQKKVPQEQVVPFLMSLGYRGLAGAVASRMRLEKASEGLKSLQQAQGQSPAPPTVAQENAQQAQQMQQQVQQAMAARRPQMMQQSQPAMPIQSARSGGIMSVYSGGGPIAFQEGAIVPRVLNVNPAGEVLPPIDDLIAAYEKAAGNPAEQSRIERIIRRVAPNLDLSSVGKYARENLPTFTRYAEKVAPTVTKYGTKLVKGAPAIGAGFGLLGASQSDPESIQRTSRLAQLGLMDVDPSSKTKTGLATLTGVAESAIPLVGLFYDTPLDRAEAMTAAAKAPPLETTLSPEETATAQEYNRIVRRYGANSKEAKDFEAMYRASKGNTPPSVDSELARIMSQSAAGTPAEGVGGPRLPSVPVQRDIYGKPIAELRKRLEGIPDVSKPEARQAEVDKEIAARMKRYTDMGIMKPFDDAKENVQGRLKELEGIKDKNFYKAMAMMGFTMAGTRGSFFQALAAGGAAGLSAYETFEERRQATLDKLQDRMMNIDMGIANLKKSASSEAEARVDKLESERNRITDQIMNLQTAGEQLASTQAFQLALSDREIAAQAARDESRFGGLSKGLEKQILVARDIASGKTVDPATGKPYPPDIRAAAKKEAEDLYDELEKATQALSGSYQSAGLKAGAGQIPYYKYPMVGSGQSEDDPYGVNALVAQYGQQ